jgi:hypothetical protein
VAPTGAILDVASKRKLTKRRLLALCRIVENNQ